MTQTRKVVLSLGPLDSALEDVLVTAGFPVNSIPIAEFGGRAPQARALIIRFRELTRFLSQFRATRDVAIDHGVLIMVIVETPKPQDQWQAWHAIQLNFLQTHPAKPIQIRFPNPALVALDIAAWHARPGLNSSLVIEPSSIPPDHRFLLARAFSKYVRIVTNRIDGGASGAAVYRVTAFRAPSEQHPIPFLAKIDEATKIKFEQDTFRQFIRDNIPFNLRPNIITPRTCYTAKQGIIVEDFVERALRFDEALTVGAPAQLVASLFQGTLRGCRLVGSNAIFSTTKTMRRTDSSGQETGLVRKNEKFAEACAAATKYFNREYDPGDIVRRVESLPPQETHHCTIHADLHARNVFVAAGSTDCFIIDYANAERGPACMDPACLEVDLVLFSKRSPSGRFLKSAYSWPLQPLNAAVRQQCENWLWEAVRALRIEAEVATTRSAYTMALIGYLLRLARIKSVKLRKRAVAVCVAEWLLCRIENDQTTNAGSPKKISKHSSGPGHRGRSRRTRSKR